MIVNLDSNFSPFGTGIPFTSITFSGGEPHVRFAPVKIESPVKLTARIRSWNDMGLLLVATDALRRMGAVKIDLLLPYMPGARQDRVEIPGEALTVKVYAQVINQQNYSSVTIFDPHSEVSAALLENVRVISNVAFIRACLKMLPECLLVAPDAGAQKKIFNLAREIGKNEVVPCSKHRDARTGKLSGFEVPITDLKGKDCLIVDDICDGGATFVGLAEQLKAHNAGKLYLAVSHGIFSKGMTALASTFDKIFTTDSFYFNESLSNDHKVTVIPMANFIQEIV